MAETAKRAVPGTIRADASIRTAWVAAMLCLVLSAVTFRATVAALGVFLEKEPVALRAGFETLPTTLGHWQRIGTDVRYDDVINEELGTSSYLNRTFVLDGDPNKGVLELHIAYYTGFIDTVPHVPERCWGAAGLEIVTQPHPVPVVVDRSGWNMERGPLHSSGARYPVVTVIDNITGSATDVHMPLNELALNVTEFQNPETPAVRFISGYLFLANGRATPSPYEVRSLAFNLSERYAYYCKVQFSARFAQAEGAEGRYSTQVADLFSQLLPPLMRVLPDWPAYEAKSVSPNDNT